MNLLKFIRNNPRKKFFVQYDQKKFSTFFRVPYLSNPFLVEKRASVKSLLQVLSKVAVIMNGNVLHYTVKMGVLIFKVLILISHTVPWHTLTPSESEFLLQL